MIQITNIRNMNPKAYDKAYVIVRSLKTPISYAEQLSVLSPNTTIFYEFLKFKKNGQWNQKTFDEWYTPAFVNQIKQDTNAKQTLKNILQMDKQGLNIVLACFCTDPNMCHRNIIAGILKENGGNVYADGQIKTYGLQL